MATYSHSVRNVTLLYYLLISLRFERAWCVTVRARVIKYCHQILNPPHAYAHASRSRITLTRVRSEVKLTLRFNICVLRVVVA